MGSIHWFFVCAWLAGAFCRYLMLLHYGLMFPIPSLFNSWRTENLVHYFVSFRLICKKILCGILHTKEMDVDFCSICFLLKLKHGSYSFRNVFVYVKTMETTVCMGRC
ncbi:UNVERIFIED_CONTAM: hypothetical protein K2H54_046678 [Gekko kuhli]